MTNARAERGWRETDAPRGFSEIEKARRLDETAKRVERRKDHVRARFTTAMSNSGPSSRVIKSTTARSAGFSS